MLQTASSVNTDERTRPAPPLARELGAAVALATAVLAVRVAVFAGKEGQHFLIDDAFISFRYARNLASGLGLVFNEGERVEGYTNFLWTLLLAGAARMGLDIVSTSVVLAMVATIGTIVVLAAFGRALFAERPHATLLIAIAPVLFALFGGQARYVVSGMETSLFVFLVTLGAYLSAAASRPLLAGAALAAASLTRPEGALYFGAVVLFELTMSTRTFRERVAAAGWLIGTFALIVTPYYVWRMGYYGSPLPNTFYAKSGGELTQLMLRRGLMHLWAGLRESALLLPGLVAAFALVRRRHRFWFLAGGLLVIATTELVLVGGDFFFFFGPRVLMPALPCLYLMVAAGVGTIAELLFARRGLQIAAMTAVSGVLAVYMVWFSWPARDRNLPYVAAINEGWTELGTWLRAYTEPNATIAVGAIGRIPYYSEHRTIDMLGLTDPHIARRQIALGAGMPGHEKYDTPYVLGRNPDYVIFVLLGPGGQPAVQDWSLVADTFTNRYELFALVKASRVPGPWVLETPEWTPELARMGYQAGVYRRRTEMVRTGDTNSYADRSADRIDSTTRQE